MLKRELAMLTAAVVGLTMLGGCADEAARTPVRADPGPSGLQAVPASAAPDRSAPAVAPVSPSPRPSATRKPVKALPQAGNPGGRAAIPAEARAVDTSKPDRTVGNGTPASCTSAAVVKAVARGGVIVFDCGAAPVTIAMTATAKVRNTSSKVVLDGGGRVTLSGGGQRRILYMNTCDGAQTWTTSHCNDQATPKLTVQNLMFAKGNSTGETGEGGGGGAIFARGGRLKVVNSRFVGNRCDPTGPDLGGGAVFFVSNDRSGTLKIRNSKLLDNPSAGFETAGLPGIFYLGRGKPSITRSTLRK